MGQQQRATNSENKELSHPISQMDKDSSPPYAFFWFGAIITIEVVHLLSEFDNKCQIFCNQPLSAIGTYRTIQFIMRRIKVPQTFGIGNVSKSFSGTVLKHREMCCFWLFSTMTDSENAKTSKVVIPWKCKETLILQSHLIKVVKHGFWDSLVFCRDKVEQSLNSEPKGVTGSHIKSEALEFNRIGWIHYHYWGIKTGKMCQFSVCSCI